MMVWLSFTAATRLIEQAGGWDQILRLDIDERRFIATH